MKLFFTSFIAIFFFSSTVLGQFKLVVNEFSQGTAGSGKEFIELLVVGIRTCKDSTADIRNWIFDDNNGWYGGNGSGIATGHYRFANNANWAAVPYGSIILLYNNADKNIKITQPNDPTDANKDYVYIVPINTPLIEENNASPISPSTTTYVYPTTGYTAAGSTWTTLIGLANSGDAIIIVNPANLGSPHFSITYGGIAGAGFLTPTVKVPFAVNTANNCYLTNDQYNIAASWAEGNVPANETPGAGNTAANIAWINSMRVQIPAPKMIITNPAVVCAPNTINIAAPAVTAGSTPATLVFTYYTDPSATTVYTTPATATNGTYYIVGTIPGGCADTLPVTASVTPGGTPITGFSYSPAAVCTNAADPALNTIAGFNSGGVYTASPAGLSIHSNTGAINVSASSPGSYTITYTLAASSCNPISTNTTSFTITALAAPVTGFSYSPTIVCAVDADPTLNTVTGFATGGIYAALPTGLIIDPNTGAINVAASTPGSYIITYSVAASGCTAAGTASTSFTINPSVTPETQFSYSTVSVCAGAANPVFIPAPGFNTTGTFTVSPPGLSINASTGAINVGASAIGNYTIIYSVAASGCNPVSNNSSPFIINSTTPAVTGFSYSPVSVCTNSANPVLNTVTGFVDGGAYTVSPTGLSIDANTGAINVAASSPGNYTITYSMASNGCNTASSSTAPFTITGPGTAVTSFSYTVATVCENAVNPTLNTITGFTTGGTYTASPAGLSINASTGAINVAASAPGNYTVTYSVVANGCITGGASTSPFIITAAVNPVMGFSYTPTAVCANGVNPTISNVAGFTTGGTYTTSPAGLSINASTGAINVAASTTGNYTITYSLAANGCNPAATNTATFGINATGPAVTSFSYIPASACANAANPALNTIAGFTAGGTYTASPVGLNINLNTGAVNIAASTPGTYTITYTVAATGCTAAGFSTSSFTITPVINPVTGFSYTPAAVCENGSNPTINNVLGFTTGGTYTSSPTGLSINGNTGAINMAASLSGNYTITYTVVANGCNPAASTTASFTINSIVAPVTNFNYTPSTVCENGTNPALNTGTGFTGGGSYTASPAGLNINATTGTIDVAASTAGNYIIAYTVIATGCNPIGVSTSTFKIIAVINPVTGFNYTPTTVCENGLNPTINHVAGFTTGGTYTSSPAGLSINANTGTINVPTSTAGNYIVTYSLATNGCQAAATNSSPFTLNPVVIPVTNFSYTPAIVCVNGTAPALSVLSGFTTGGTYAATPAGLSINANTGAINVAASTTGNYTITYSIAASGCNPAASSTTLFSINALGAATTGFSYTPAVACINAVTSPVLNTVSGFTGGGTYIVSPAGLSINANTGAIDLTTSTPGNYIITYTLIATACTPAATSTTNFTITESVTPVTAFNYFPGTICINGANPVVHPGSGFTTGGTYTSTAGLSINVNTGTINLAASTAGNYTITYTVAATGCNPAASSTTALNVTSISTPVTSFNFSPNTVCANGINPSLIPNSNFATGGIYTASPAGLSINANTGFINVAASNAGNYTVTYSVIATGCFGAASSNTIFTINPNTTPITSFTYPTPICITSANPIPSTPTGFTAGGTFTAPASLSTNGATGVIDLAASTAGNYMITYSVPANGCRLAGTGAASINIIAAPASPVIPTAAACNGGTATLTASATGIIKWYSNSTLSNLIFTGNIYNTSISSNTQFFVTATAGSCVSNPAIANAVISSKPATPNLGNDTSICNGDAIVLNAGIYNSYLWSTGSVSPTITVTDAGTYSVKAFNSTGCFADTSITITLLANCDDIYFPSAFSPNGDSYNDKFGALGNLFVVKNYTLTIFNRYGEVVFVTNNPYQKWDGIFKGSKNGSGTFVWYARYNYRGKISKIQKGNVTLIR